MKKTWTEILFRNCIFYKGLAGSKKEWFEKLLINFLDIFEFEGKDVDVNDEMRVTVAGWASLMISGQATGVYCLSHIKVFVIHKGDQTDSGVLGLMSDGVIDCRVHLAWKAVLASIKNPLSSSNIILHELAHALDQHDRRLDGIPRSFLADESIQNWERYFNNAHIKKTNELCSLWNYFNLSQWEQYYKNENPSNWPAVEAFAVATERYFSQPRKLYKIDSKVYYLLDDFYKQFPLLEDEPSSLLNVARVFALNIREFAIKMIYNTKM